MKTTLRIVLLAAATSACLVAGDLTITFKSKTKGLMGMSSEGNQIHYYSTDYHKTVDEATKVDTLVDYSKGMFYTIKHKDKKIESITFDDLVEVGNAASARLEQMGGMPDFMKGMLGGGDPGQIKVEQTGTDTVAGRPCKDYKLSIGKIVDELSMDPTLKPPVNPAAYAKFMKLRANMFPGPSSASMKKLYEELSKLQGLALKMHMTGFMGGDTTLEATDVKTSPIAATVFALPDGYKTEDLGKKLLKDMKKD